MDNKNTSDWTYTWTDLPRYDADGNRYNYTVDEELTQELTGKEYRVSVIKRPYIDGAEFTVLNIREPETASITVNKTWNDQDDNDGKRPKTLTFHIWGTSKQPKSGSTDETEDVTEQLVVQTVRTNGSNTQSWTFEGLPKAEPVQQSVHVYGNRGIRRWLYGKRRDARRRYGNTLCGDEHGQILRVRCDQHAYARNHDIERGQDVG